MCLAISNGALFVFLVVGAAERDLGLLSFLAIFPIIAMLGLVGRLRRWVRVCAVLPSGLLWFLMGVMLIAVPPHRQTDRRVRIPLEIFLLVVGGLSVEPLFPSKRRS